MGSLCKPTQKTISSWPHRLFKRAKSLGRKICFVVSLAQESYINIHRKDSFLSALLSIPLRLLTLDRLIASTFISPICPATVQSRIPRPTVVVSFPLDAMSALMILSRTSLSRAFMLMFLIVKRKGPRFQAWTHLRWSRRFLWLSVI